MKTYGQLMALGSVGEGESVRQPIQSQVVSSKHMYIQAALNGLDGFCVCVCVCIIIRVLNLKGNWGEERVGRWRWRVEMM